MGSVAQRQLTGNSMLGMVSAVRVPEASNTIGQEEQIWIMTALCLSVLTMSTL
jgi:hypothetical protein